MARTNSRTTPYRLPNQSARYLLDRLAERRKTLGTFRARANERRSRAERIADGLTGVMGSVPFLIFHVCLFAVWLSINLRLIPGLSPFDPFPFGLLTMALTLEQSLLTIFIIMSQNRSSEIADLRNEMDLQINIVAEEEISKALRLLHLIGERLDIAEIINDPDLPLMEQSLDHAEVEKQTRQELDAPLPTVTAASDWTPTDGQ
jgi:uncharacterized membrane protein